MKKVLLFIAPVLILIISMTFGSGCANIIPPSGGPRDSLPPVLVNATPTDSTTNFRSNRITLTFDEFIDLHDVQQNLLFTPIFESNPIVEARLRTITIRIRDSLEANTTYSFNFGNAVRDINEGNILRNFDYIFSTGPYLDSLTLSGKVTLAETGGVDTTMIVVLHTNMDDSAIVNQRPRYVTRLDRQGNFTFRNLPADTFAIYALGDAGLSRRYQNKSQLFAFADTTVRPSADSAAPITLYAYRQTPAAPVTSTAAATGGRPNAADRRLRYTTNLANNQQSLLDSLILGFERPLRLFDSTRITLFTDSTFNPVTNFSVNLDTSKKRITLITPWQPDTYYNLILDRDFAEDSLGRKLLKTDTVSFTTRKEADYGAINLRLRNVDTSLNPVLQFVQDNKVLFSTPIRSGTFSQRLFLPGDYEFRILYDANGNGKWDPGQFFGTKKQPELVRPLEGRRTVKPAWDNDFEIIL